MPFLPNRVEAPCGVNGTYLPIDTPATTVRRTILIEDYCGPCGGCTFKLDFKTGEKTLISDDPNRKCKLPNIPVKSH